MSEVSFYPVVELGDVAARIQRERSLLLMRLSDPFGIHRIEYNRQFLLKRDHALHRMSISEARERTYEKENRDPA